MKKHILGILAAVCLTLVLTPTARAAHVVNYAVTGGSIQIDTDTGTVTDCDGSVTEAKIPAKIGDCSVTSIGGYAFYACGNLTSVTIPNSVTSIGHSAFSECRSLTSVTIPNSVTSIGNYAFNECNSLTSVTIPNSVTSIGHRAFAGCFTLTGITIPDSVTSIGSYAFEYCSSLTSITLSDSMTSIADGAFFYCYNLTSVTIPNSVTSIGEWVFISCSSLTSVTIPNSVTSIGDSAFSGSRSLTSVTIPNSVISIGRDAFRSCSSLTAIMVAEDNPSYSAIDGVLFNKAGTILHEYPGGKNGAYSIPSGVTSIGDGSFAGCDRLTSVSVPVTVTSVGISAFFNCANLTDVFYDGTEKEYKTKLYPNVDSFNERFVNAAFHFKDGVSPDPAPTLPNTAASDNTTLHGTLFLLLAALTLTVWALGRKKKDNQTNK